MANRYVLEIFVISLYIALGIVPFVYIRYYPFLDKLRFSKYKIAIIFLLLVALEIYIFIKIEKHTSLLGLEDSGVFRVSFFAIYFILSCISIKENFFKHFLVYLVCSMFITTLTTMVYFISSKFHSDIPYLVPVITMALLSIPFIIFNFIFTKKILTPLINKADVRITALVCSIPFTILVINGLSTYDLSWSLSIPVKYIAIRLFSFLGTLEVIVIFKVLVDEQQNRLALSEEVKRQEIMLAIQKEQFYSLSEKIKEARRIRHDLKHHFAAVQSFLANEEYDKLLEYVNKENSFIANDDKLIFCENMTVNAILSYYYKKSKALHHFMEAVINIPANLKIEDTELWVLFGNLLENALESCERIDCGEKKIMVKSYYRDNMLFILVDNPINEDSIKKSPDGFVSSKKSGLHGVGIESIRFLTEKLGGSADFEIKNGLFLASVYIPA